ncbi:MAG: NifU N-terminal domain-containing protein [Phycisphaerales bacterium]|nr:NifU N-terminal domain-containing protein [Phycisphaerales bacterium]
MAGSSNAKSPGIRYQDTPNPNAIKCVVEQPIPALPGRPGPRSYSSAETGKEDPLASAIFGIPGVVNVLIADLWLTINREPGKDWKPIKQGLERILRQELGSSPTG